LAAPRIGVVCITSGFGPRESALSGGGALSGFPFRRRCHLAARAVGEATFRHRTFAGHPSMSASGSFVGALAHGGASAASVETVEHGRCGGVVQRLRHHSFGRVRPSSPSARLERRAEVSGIDGSGCGVTIAPLGG